MLSATLPSISEPSEGANEQNTIEKAAERFEIPPDRCNRIAVQKTGKDKD
jgi:hypothetical protein